MSRPAVGSSCDCHATKLHIVHQYLKEQFPDSALRDFHAPSRLLQDGLPAPNGDHHVVSIEQVDALPYYAVLLNEIFDRSVDEMSADLLRWQLGDVLRAHRIVIVSNAGASAL